jgi:hypothetical protein
MGKEERCKKVLGRHRQNKTYDEENEKMCMKQRVDARVGRDWMVGQLVCEMREGGA